MRQFREIHNGACKIRDSACKIRGGTCIDFMESGQTVRMLPERRPRRADTLFALSMPDDAGNIETILLRTGGFVPCPWRIRIRVSDAPSTTARITAIMLNTADWMKFRWARMNQTPHSPNARTVRVSACADSVTPQFPRHADAPSCLQHADTLTRCPPSVADAPQYSGTGPVTGPFLIVLFSACTVRHSDE